MKPPIFVRTLSKHERQELEAALRSSDAFVLRRAQSVANVDVLANLFALL